MLIFTRCRDADWVSTLCGWKSISDNCDEDQVVTGMSSEQGNGNEGKQFNVQCYNVSTIQSRSTFKIRFVHHE